MLSHIDTYSDSGAPWSANRLAQHALQGRSHYYYKGAPSKAVHFEPVCKGMLLLTVESYPSAGYKIVIFDVFGSAIRINDTRYKSKNQALKDAYTYLNAFDLHAYYLDRIDRAKRNIESQCNTVLGWLS